MITIPSAITKTFYRGTFELKKHCPEILLASGIVGGIASAVMACKATTKVESVLADTQDRIDKIHEVVEDENISEEQYSVEDSKKDLAIVYIQTGVKLAKLYAPSVILGSMSIVSILASNNIMRKRNIALAAAYAVVDKNFKDYRSRVVDRFGSTVDRELKYDLKANKVIEKVVDEETGKTKKVKKTVYETQIENGQSGYDRLYTFGNSCFENDASLNLAYLQAQEKYVNDLLRNRGYVFLYEVYKVLGFKPDAASHQVGWVYEEDNPIGDNYIDFGFRNSAEFMSGKEPSVWLCFNVDGPIINRFEPLSKDPGVC